MKILYLSPIFEMSNDPGSDRYAFFCKGLAARGHHVTVLTSAVIYKQAKVRAECRGRLRSEVTTDGIRIIYLWSYPYIHGSLIRRLIYILSYMIMALLIGLFVERSDVIYSPNSPGMVGFAGYLLSLFRRIPLVFEVADVWPDAGIAMGTLTNPLIIYIMKKMEDACYRRAVRITALTRGIKANIESKGYPSNKVVMITNGVDPVFIKNVPQERTEELRANLKLINRFIGLYLGAFGQYNSLWTIIEAADCLKEDKRFVFVLIGDGDYKDRLQSMVQRLGLDNVIFQASIPRKECPEYLSLADVFLLPNRKGEFFRMNLPNKLFDFLASGRPIIVAGEGETGDLVREAGAGMVVPAEDATSMAAAIRQLAGLTDIDRQRIGEKGYSFVVNHYSRFDQLEQIEKVLLIASGS